MSRPARWLALLLGLFHLLNVSGFVVLSTMDIRIFHLTVILGLAFLTNKQLTRKPTQATPRWLVLTSYLATLLAATSGLFMLSRWEAIARSGTIDTPDLIVGVIIIALVILTALLFVGRALAIITSVFLLYPFFCHYLPGIFYSRSYSAERIVEFLVHTGQGIYGIPIGVASTYIILFTIYGAFLSQFGAGDFFFKLARSITRGLTAASAKAAVLFSALLGTVSGSAAGNVAVTGSFTIPMMKKEGYTAEQSSAIEAVVSTGGQIMPPVMGAAAFIMAEIIGEPYLNVMQAAIIPATLFFVSILCVVHLQARKLGLKSDQDMASDKNAASQSFFKTVLDGIPLIIPFITLIVLMLMGYSPFKACFWSIISLLLAQLLFRPWEISDISLNALKAIRRGAINAIPISIACAAAGIIAGILAMSGLGAKLSSFIAVLSGGIPIVALCLTAITAIILGMGLPTTAAYLILATVIAPALATMGVPLITAHMFVFFFGCISTITPPVALASYVAAGIGGANINKVGWTAFRFGLVCFILPFMFFYGPALLAQDTMVNTALGVVSGMLGVFCIAAGIVGFQRTALRKIARALYLITGVLLLKQGLPTDLLGLLVLAGLFVMIKPSNTVGSVNP